MNFAQQEQENLMKTIHLCQLYKITFNIVWAVWQIKDKLEYTSDKNKSLTPINQLLIALRFYATGRISLLLVNDDTFSVRQQYVVQFTKVTAAIASLQPKCQVSNNKTKKTWRDEHVFYTIKAARCHRCCWWHSCSNSVTRRPRCTNLQEQKVSLFTIDAGLNSAATAIQAASLSRVVTLSVFSFSIMSTRDITRSVSSCRSLALALAACLL